MDIENINNINNKLSEYLNSKFPEYDVLSKHFFEDRVVISLKSKTSRINRVFKKLDLMFDDLKGDCE